MKRIDWKIFLALSPRRLSSHDSPCIVGIFSKEIELVLPHNVKEQVRICLKRRRVRFVVAATPTNPFCPIAVPTLVDHVATFWAFI